MKLTKTVSFKSKKSTKSIRRKIKFCFLLKNVEKKDSFYQYNLGLCYYNGIGTSKNLFMAYYWYKKSAENGYHEAQYKIGDYIYNQRKIFDWYETSLDFLKKSAEQNNINAICKLAEIFCEENKYEEALDLLYSAKNADNVEILYRIGMFHFNDLVKNTIYCDDDDYDNFEMACFYFKEAANKGSINSCYILGICHILGKGVDKSYKKAIEFFNHLVRSGYSHIYHILGYLYSIIGENSLQESIFWYEKGASVGCPVSLYYLGCLYLNGTKFEKNYVKAVELFTDSARKNFAKANLVLSICYLNGFGVNIDPHEALKYFKKSEKLIKEDDKSEIGSFYDWEGAIKFSKNDIYQFYLKDANEGCVNAQINLGIHLLFHHESIELRDAAYKWFLLASMLDKNNIFAQAMTKKIKSQIPHQSCVYEENNALKLYQKILNNCG